MEIYRDREVSKLWLTQKNYLKKFLERFSMFNAKPVQTPLAVHFRLSSEKCLSTEDEVEYMTRVPYENTVGCLMYAIVCTRLDISYTVSVVRKYIGNPRKRALECSKVEF